MPATQRFSDLPAACQRLVRTAQQLGFGRIEHLVLARGVPAWQPAPRRVQELKLGPSGTMPSVRPADFELPQQWLDLFRQFARIRDGVVDRVEVQNGLPFRIVFALPAD